MRRLHRLVQFCLLSSLAITTYAGNRPGTIPVSAGVGNIYFASTREINNTGFGFIGAGYNFTYHWGIDSIIGFFNTTPRNNANNGKRVNGTLFAIDALYRFEPFHNFEPYVLAGPGIMGLNPNGTDPNNEGNINAGIGTQYFFDKSLAFKVEARDFYTITGGGKNDVLLDIGVTYLFGC